MGVHDAVGGPLANLPQDAVQEFQIATNRFSAEQGRSAASAVNVVTKTGTDALHGALSSYLRDARLQGLPATADRTQAKPSFDREQYSATLGGPLARGKAWWFGAVEYRHQNAVVQVGERNTVTRTIDRAFAPAPLRDLLATGRVDAQPSPKDNLSLRYSFEDAQDTGASTLDRAIGSASQRQTSTNKYNMGLLTWTRTFSSTSVNTFRASYSDYQNAIEPVTPGVQATQEPAFQNYFSLNMERDQVRRDRGGTAPYGEDAGSAPRERRTLREIAADAAKHRVGKLVLIALVAESPLLVGIRDERGLDKDRRNVRRLQYRESRLLDVVLVQRIDLADLVEHQAAQLQRVGDRRGL